MSQELPPSFNSDTRGGKPTSKPNQPQSGAKNLLSSLGATAGAAAKLVARQAERTKLTTMTLPAAYRDLGKDCVQQKRHLDCVPELMQQLRSVMADLKLLSEAAKSQPAAQTLTDKAKAAGKQAADFARQKQLGMKRDSLLGEIGKAIHELHGDASGPAELVASIRDALSRLSEVNTDISRLSEVGKGSLLTPKRLLIGGAIALVLVGAYFVFPRTSGDVDWSAERDEERVAARAKYEPVFLQMLKAGDSAWDAGTKADAVQHYSQLLGQFCGYGQQDRTVVADLHKPEMARVAGRTIDFLADSGNDETAKDLIKKADQSELVIVYSSPKVNRLVREAKVDQQREDKETEDWLERNSDFGVNLEIDGDSELSANKQQDKSITSRPSSGSGFQPSSTSNSAADEAVNNMRRAGTLTPQAERNIREFSDNYEKAMKK